MPLGKTKNPMLQKVEQAAQAKIPHQMLAQFARVIKAGLTIMYSPNLRPVMIQKMKNPQDDPVTDAGKGAAALLGELNQQSKGTLTSAIALPAAAFFICEYMDLYNKIMQKPVTQSMVAQATQLATTTMLNAAGITPQQIQGMQQAKAQAAPSGGIINSQKQAA